MTPELFQSHVLGLYSLLLLSLALLLLVRRRRRLRALSSRPPCLDYLQIRLECSRMFDKKEDASSPSRFADLTLQIRYLYGVHNCIPSYP